MIIIFIILALLHQYRVGSISSSIRLENMSFHLIAILARVYVSLSLKNELSLLAVAPLNPLLCRLTCISRWPLHIAFMWTVDVHKWISLCNFILQRKLHVNLNLCLLRLDTMKKNPDNLFHMFCSCGYLVFIFFLYKLLLCFDMIPKFDVYVLPKIAWKSTCKWSSHLALQCSFCW